MTWEDDFQTDWLKVGEGRHRLRITDDPVEVESKFHGTQWAFLGARLDGVAGKLSPPRRLGALILQQYHDHGDRWPVEFVFRREGMGLDTRFVLEVQEELA